MRKKREAELHNRFFTEHTRGRLAKFYSITESSRKFYEEFLLRECRGKRILEYGCGLGSYAFFLAKKGSEVTGIDISKVAIEQAKAKAIEEDMVDKTTFLVMDAEATDFADESFDIICGTGILHHLDLNVAVKELARVLKPGGKAIFIEPLGYNPAINLYRAMTPNMRTPDEHPLLRKDLALTKCYFQKVETEFFHLLSLLAIPFRNTPKFHGLVRLLDKVDAMIFKLLPVVKLLAWTIVITVSQPKKDGEGRNGTLRSQEPRAW